VLEPTGTASHGGFKDWFIDELKKPGFTIEIGKGTNPLPISELQPIYARLLESLILGIIL
jgi:g-D-glutamyl-meso-diaminopimelate peptidase